MLKRLLIALALAAAVLLAPHIVRFYYFDNYMLGDEPYYHARIARHIQENGYVNKDPVLGTDIEFSPYHYLLAFVGGFTGILTATNFLPFIAGLISVVFYFLLAEKHIGSPLTAAAMWIISPIFIYSFTVSTPFAIVLALNLAGIYFLAQGKWYSVPILAVLPLFGFLSSIATLSVAGIVLYRNRSRLAWTAVIMLIVLGIASLSLGLPGLEPKISLTDNLAFLGAPIGFNAFAFILGCIGFVSSWKEQKKPLLLLSIFVFAAICLFDPGFKILLNVFVSGFAALGLLSLIRMRWELKIIRNLTLAILGLALLLTTFSYLSWISFSEPSTDKVQALKWLDQRQPGTILTQSGNANWVAYFTDSNAVQDDELLRTRDEELARERFVELEIRYVFVDSKTLELMKEENRIGLLFLMENSRDYSLVHARGDIEVWRASFIS